MIKFRYWSWPGRECEWVLSMRQRGQLPTLSGVSMVEVKALAVVGHAGPTSTRNGMSAPHALAALAALGQSTRLEIVRLLMRSGSHGLLAGSIADAIGCPHNTLSSHLSILARAGLIGGTREGRTILYRADVNGMRSLLSFLVADCCDGHPELCNFITKSASCSPRIKISKRGKKP
jgi:ArsR family transcriptional regulator, arsenate/arsenite/antimonite-responsive transcriptional repressor